MTKLRGARAHEVRLYGVLTSSLARTSATRAQHHEAALTAPRATMRKIDPLINWWRPFELKTKPWYTFSPLKPNPLQLLPGPFRDVDRLEA